MGFSASVNMGNKTSSTVTNSTSNEQLINVSNVVSINNSMRQATALVAAQDNSTDMNTMFNQVIKLENATIEIQGDNNKVTISNDLSSEQKADVMGVMVGTLNHATDVVDSVLFDIAVHGTNRQQADMTSAANAAKTTEVEASGIGTMAVAVGINNSVLTSVNNSIRNVFSMVVNNHLSSNTSREAIATNITQASNAVNLDVDAKQTIDVNGLNLTINGNNNLYEMRNDAEGNLGSKIMSKIDSNVSSTLKAVTNHTANASTTIDTSQTAVSRAEATASDTVSVSAVTIPAIFIVIALIAGGVLLVKGLSTVRKTANETVNGPGLAAAIAAAQEVANNAVKTVGENPEIISEITKATAEMDE